MENIIYILILNLLIGLVLYFVINFFNNDKVQKKILDAEKIAEQIKKEKILQAKERFIEFSVRG